MNELLQGVRDLFAPLWKGIPKGITKQGQPAQRPKKKAPGHRYKEYDHSDDKAHQTAEQYSWRNQFILTFFITLFAFGTVVFAYKTFVQTQRQADIAQDTLKEIRDGSVQTDRAVVAAEQSAKAAEAQVRVSQSTAMQELRPYVYLRLDDIPRKGADGIVSFRRRFGNTGRSAALETQRLTSVGVYARLPGGGSGLVYPSDQEVANTREVDFIAPGAERDTYGLAGENLISADQWNEVLAHKGLFLAEWGTVRYKDIFGQLHHLWFCNTWDGQSDNTQHCPRGNSMD